MTPPQTLTANGKLIDLDGAPHGFRVVSTTRAFGEDCGRDLEYVAEGLRREISPPAGTRFAFAGQVHGGTVRRVPASPGQGSCLTVADCDALVSRDPRIIPVVRTADCVPVVVASVSKHWTAAVHAGWRGTRVRLVENTVRMALEDGISADDLRVWIGPCISGSVYEVSEELANDFRREFPGCEGFACGRRIDLSILNRFQALNLGVEPENVVEARLCTFEREALFPSYRRDGQCRTQIYTLGFHAKEPAAP